MKEDEVKRIDQNNITEGSICHIKNICHIKEFYYISAVMGICRAGLTWGVMKRDFVPSISLGQHWEEWVEEMKTRKRREVS